MCRTAKVQVDRYSLGLQNSLGHIQEKVSKKASKSRFKGEDVSRDEKGNSL